MKQYIAKYRQGKMAWIKAESFPEAVTRAIILEEGEKPVPSSPERFEEYETEYFGTKKRESKEYRDWRREKDKIENYNQNRRADLIHVSEFMPKK